MVMMAQCHIRAYDKNCLWQRGGSEKGCAAWSESSEALTHKPLLEKSVVCRDVSWTPGSIWPIVFCVCILYL
jgi:hypothetical protein